jgi:hypothetical protein
MKTFFTSICLLFLTVINAQVTWDFGASLPGSASPSSGILANSTVSAVTRLNGSANGFLETTSASNNVGASGGVNAAAVAATGAFNVSTSTYFEFTITPASGFRIAIVGASMNSRSTGTGPTQFSLRTSFDNFVTDVSTSTAAQNSTWSAKTFSPFTSATGGIDLPVVIRIYGFGGAASGANNWRIDDLKFIYAVSVLSVNLKSFTATQTNLGTNLKWQTNQESNIKNYTVEKSTNGVNYSSIATINANNAPENIYQFTDVNVSKGSSLYRIKITSTEDKISYSSIVRVSNDINNTKLTIYPAVSNAKITADFYAEKYTHATIVIIDAAGKITNQQIILVNGGKNNLPITINNLANGVYRLRIVGENINYITSFIKN